MLRASCLVHGRQSSYTYYAFSTLPETAAPPPPTYLYYNPPNVRLWTGANATVEADVSESPITATGIEFRYRLRPTDSWYMSSYLT